MRSLTVLFLLSTFSVFGCADVQPGEAPDRQAPAAERVDISPDTAKVEAQDAKGEKVLRPCCSSCPLDDFEDHCWGICALSC